MLRRCVLTVFSETDSSPAISGRDRFVGRYRSTLSSPGLSSSAGGHEDCLVAAGGALQDVEDVGEQRGCSGA